MQVFLSYSRKDSAVMQRVRAELESDIPDLQVWTDEHLQPGDISWPDEIESAIQNSQALLVLLSPDANNSTWVKRELAYANTHEVHIIPLLVRGTERDSVPIALISHERVDLRTKTKYEAEMERLIKSLCSRLGLDSRAEIEQRLADAEVVRIQQEAELQQRAEALRLRQETLSEGRRLDAAMPQYNILGNPTEVRLKIALPDSLGLEAELPDITPSGELIEKGDVRTSTFQVRFPVSKTSGELESALVCIELTTDSFEIIPKKRSSTCQDYQAELIIPLNSDSSTIAFQLIPKPNVSLGTKRVFITLYQDSSVIAETTISTEVVDSLGEFKKVLWNVIRLYIATTTALSTSAETTTSRKFKLNEPRAIIIAAVITGVLGAFGAALTTGVFGRQQETAEVTPILETPTTATTASVATVESSATIAPAFLAYQVAELGVTSNAEWTPYIEVFDGVEMALVPAGCFQMGSEDGLGNESPVHEVCFEEPFFIDIYEVSNAQYGSIGCEEYSSEPDQPRNCISWYEAKVHCESRGARLPTEAEWEYAARGPDNLVYPWGNSFDCRAVNSDDETLYDATINAGGENCDGYVTTAPVGSFPNGASWVGALDLSGNLWEWVNDMYEATYYANSPQINPQGPTGDINLRVGKGGSWFDPAGDSRGDRRSPWEPDLNTHLNGFRCARSYDQ